MGNTSVEDVDDAFKLVTIGNLGPSSRKMRRRSRHQNIEEKTTSKLNRQAIRVRSPSSKNPFEVEDSPIDCDGQLRQSQRLQLFSDSMQYYSWRQAVWYGCLAKFQALVLLAELGNAAAFVPIIGSAGQVLLLFRFLVFWRQLFARGVPTRWLGKDEVCFVCVWWIFFSWYRGPHFCYFLYRQAPLNSASILQRTWLPGFWKKSWHSRRLVCTTYF